MPSPHKCSTNCFLSYHPVFIAQEVKQELVLFSGKCNLCVIILQRLILQIQYQVINDDLVRPENDFLRIIAATRALSSGR